MAVTNVSLTFVDGKLGLSDVIEQKICVYGVGTSGSFGAETKIKDTNDATTLLGVGSTLEQAAATVIQEAGGPIYAFRLNSGSAGASTTISKTVGTGTTPRLVLSGTAHGEFQGVVDIVAGGTLSTGSMKYSLDGGTTFSEDITLGAAGAWNAWQFTGNLKKHTGLTIGFDAGTYVAGDRYEFTCEAPTYNVVDLQDAMGVTSGSANLHTVHIIAGMPASASTANTIFSALDGHMTNFENRHRYCMAIMDAGSRDTSANVLSNCTNTSKAIALCYGRAKSTSAAPFTGYAKPKDSILKAVGARVAAIAVSTSPGRVLDGPLSSIDSSTLTHDEGLEQDFDTARILTLRTREGLPGAYIEKGFIKAPAGSDVDRIETRRVLDLARQTAHRELQKFLNSRVRILGDGTGRIRPGDALRVETPIKQALDAALLSPTNAEGFKGHVSDYSFAVDRENNIASSRELICTLTILPLVTIEQIAATVSFTLSVPVAV